MSGNVKGITIEFRGDTTKLDKALRQVDKETRSIDKELNAVNKSLKFNPGSVDLWREKQTLLKQKIGETEDKLKLLKQQQATMDANGVDKNSLEYQKLQREIIETESKLKNFKGQLRAIGNVKLRAISEQMKVTGASVTAAGQKMRGLSTAAGIAAGAIGALAVKSGKWADDLNTMSKVYGINTRELQKYSAAAKLVDVDVETIAKSHTKLKRSMLSAKDGTGATAEAFSQLGVKVTDSNGNLRDADTVWQETIKSLGSMKNETERDALAMALMGKSASELNPLIEDGGKTYENVAKTLEKYNLDFIDQETLDNAQAFNDEIDSIKAIALVGLETVGAKLAEYLAPALEKVVGWVGKAANWLANLNPTVLAVVLAIAAVLAVMSPLLIVIGSVITNIGVIVGAVGSLMGVIAGLNPIFLIVAAAIAAVIAIGVLLYKNWDKIKEKAGAVKDWIIEKWTALKTAIETIFNAIKSFVLTIWNAIKTAIITPVLVIKRLITLYFTAVKTVLTTIFNTIKNVATTVFTAMKNTISKIFGGIKAIMTKPFTAARDIIKAAIDKIKSIINGAHLSLPHFKLPHFKINGGKLPWGIGGKGKAPSISVDWYAKGGIFDAASIIGVGEAGPEAVVPLDTLWKKLDNIAEASTGAPVVINVYGGNATASEIAEEVKKKLITETKNRRQAWA